MASRTKQNFRPDSIALFSHFFLHHISSSDRNPMMAIIYLWTFNYPTVLLLLDRNLQWVAEQRQPLHDGILKV